MWRPPSGLWLAGAARSAEQGLEAPFVGRDARSAVAQGSVSWRAGAAGGEGWLRCLGEAGVGKSRLRREFTNYVDGLAEQVLWHSGRCLSYGDGWRIGALAEMVRQRLGIPEDARPSRGRGQARPRDLSAGSPMQADREFSEPAPGGAAGRGRARAGSRGAGRRAGGCSSSGWRRTSRSCWCSRTCSGPIKGLLEFIEQLLDWSPREPDLHAHARPPRARPVPAGWPAGRRGAVPDPARAAR